MDPANFSVPFTEARALLCFAAPALGADPPVLIDSDGPAQGVVTLQLEELWRAGGEGGEIIVGRISDVVRHANGEVYLLDNQLCRVELFGPTGEFLRQAAVPLGNEIQDGTCYLLGDHRLAVVRGTGSSFNDDCDADLYEEEEIEPLEVICYRVQ